MPHNTLESLDYVHVPAPDVAAAERFFTTLLGGILRWRIRDGGVGRGSPAVRRRPLDPTNGLGRSSSARSTRFD